MADDGSSKTESPQGGPPMPAQEILESEIEAGEKELERPLRGLLLSGLSAGLDIGFGPLLMAVVLTSVGGELPPVVVSFMTANAYALGFVLVVLGRSELFTEHTTMAALPVLDGRQPPRALARLWAAVYASNLVGAIAFAALGTLVGKSLGVIDAESLSEIGHQMVDHDWWTIASSAVLAGWLMGLLSWLLRASQETISQIAVVWLITVAIGFAKLHHCIAGTVEVAMAVVGVGDIPMGKALTFLGWSTLGNIVGGVVCVAAVKLGHASRTSR